jgi:hypothetical protein
VLKQQSSDEEPYSFLEKAEYYEDDGEIRIAGSDWILMGGATFRDLVKGIEKILGSKATVALLEVGEHAGEGFAKTLLKKGKKKEELPSAMETFFT